MKSSRIAKLASIALAALMLQGCAVAVTGAAATTGLAIADRRSVGTQIDDEVIEFKVSDALRAHQALWNDTHIDVTSYNGIVLLSGEAPSETLRRQAGDIAAHIPKVRKVYNELRIAAPSSALSRTSDAWLTTKVKTALFESKKVSTLQVKVVTEAGTVYLMGLLPHAEANAATSIARRVGGVQRVVTLFEFTD